MTRSFIPVTLFTAALLSSKAYAQAGYNTTTTSDGGSHISPAAPIIQSSDSSLLVPSTTAIESTSAPAPVAYSQTEGATTTTSPISSDVALSSYSDVSTSQAPTSEVAVSTTAAGSSPDTYSSASTPEAYSSPVVASSDTVSATPSTDASSVAVAPSPVVASSDTALSTPEAGDSSTVIFSYAPSTTDAAGASETGVQFTYAPETTTAAPGSLLAGYIGSIVESSAAAAASSDAAVASSNGLVATLSRPAESDAATMIFAYQPSSTDAASVVATVAVGSSAVSIAPVPQSYVEGDSSSAPAAYVIGSQTASVGQTLTVDDTPVVIQTSAGETQLYAGTSAIPSALSFTTAAPSPYSFSPDSTDSADITITGAPTVMTLGVATVAQDSAGNYIVGSTTLAPGNSITQVSGSSTAVVGLETTNGTTQLVVQDASTTSTTVLPKITKPATRTVTASASDNMSEIVVNGHTYHLGPATLNAHLTGSATASSGFVTSGAGPTSATSTSTPGLQSNGATRSAWSMLLVGAGAVVLGYSLLL